MASIEAWRSGVDGRRRTLLVQATLAGTVWVGWLGLGRGHAVAAIREHWPVSVTMTLGSLVGGGTGEGGGAVAFPGFTKVLMIPADQACTFTYAIQAVGMTAASLCILWLRVLIERRALLLAAPAGVGENTVAFIVLVLLFRSRRRSPRRPPSSSRAYRPIPERVEKRVPAAV